MSRLIIQREGHARPWLFAMPRITTTGEIVGDEWTDDTARALGVEPGDGTTLLARALGAETVWLGGPPEPPPADDAETRRQAAVSALIVERAKAGDPDALAAAIARAERGDERAAAFVAECECAVEREEPVEPETTEREERR